MIEQRAVRAWRAVGPDDKVWAESSDEKEVRDMMRPGDRLFRMWRQVETWWEEVAS